MNEKRCDFLNKLNEWLKINNKHIDCLTWDNQILELISNYEHFEKDHKKGFEDWIKQSDFLQKCLKKGYKPIKIDEYCSKENIVKKVCHELGITQKELAKLMGINEGTPAQWSSKGNIPEWAIKFMNLLLEKKECEKGSGDFDFIDYLKSKGFEINKFKMKQTEFGIEYKLTFFKYS